MSDPKFSDKQNKLMVAMLLQLASKGALKVRVIEFQTQTWIHVLTSSY